MESIGGLKHQDRSDRTEATMIHTPTSPPNVTHHRYCPEYKLQACASHCPEQ